MSDYTKKQIGMAALTFAIYTVLFGWKISLLVMVTIGFHEYSHLFAARQLGLQTKGFFFIPFVGGVALIVGRYNKLSDKAIVLLAGPIGGGLLAGATALVWYVTGNPLLGMAAYWMAIVNLFNLVPISFLDGGQLLNSITNSINRTLGLVSLAVSTIIGGAIMLRWAPLIGVLIIVFGGQSVWKEYNNWKNLRAERGSLVSQEYLYPPTKMTWAQMLITVGVWLLATGLLVLLVSIVPSSKPSELIHQ